MRSLAVLLAFVVTQGSVTEGVHRCYVCVPRTGGAIGEVQAMFPGTAPILKCDDFNVGDKRFIRDCPETYGGCMTQTNGTHVTRTCVSFPVNDCKIANNIQYCYCIGSLCNHEPVSPSDDEDLSQEGSGGGAGGGKGWTTPTTTTTRSSVLTTVSSDQAARSASTPVDISRMTIALSAIAVAAVGGRWL